MVPLILASSAVLALLGLAHGVMTVRTTRHSGAFAPVDPVIREAMQRTGGIRLAPHLRLWEPWIGFNLSHSLGALIAAAVLAVPAARQGARACDDPLWVAYALVMPAVYLVISRSYWFGGPTTGISLVLVLAWAGVGVGMLQG